MLLTRYFLFCLFLCLTVVSADKGKSPRRDLEMGSAAEIAFFTRYYQNEKNVYDFAKKVSEEEWVIVEKPDPHVNDTKELDEKGRIMLQDFKNVTYYFVNGTVLTIWANRNKIISAVAKAVTFIFSYASANEGQIIGMILGMLPDLLDLLVALIPATIDLIKGSYPLVYKSWKSTGDFWKKAWEILAWKAKKTIEEFEQVIYTPAVYPDGRLVISTTPMKKPKVDKKEAGRLLIAAGSSKTERLTISMS